MHTHRDERAGVEAADAERDGRDRRPGPDGPVAAGRAAGFLEIRLPPEATTRESEIVVGGGCHWRG